MSPGSLEKVSKCHYCYMKRQSYTGKYKILPYLTKEASYTPILLTHVQSGQLNYGELKTFRQFESKDYKSSRIRKSELDIRKCIAKEEGVSRCEPDLNKYQNFTSV